MFGDSSWSASLESLFLAVVLAVVEECLVGVSKLSLNASVSFTMFFNRGFDADRAAGVVKEITFLVKSMAASQSKNWISVMGYSTVVIITYNLWIRILGVVV